MKLVDAGRLPSLSSSKLTPPNFQGSRDFPVHLKKDAKTEIPDPIDIRTEFKFSNSLTNTPEEVDRPVKQEGKLRPVNEKIIENFYYVLNKNMFKY